jgi:uncharacterized membrane protein
MFRPEPYGRGPGFFQAAPGGHPFLHLLVVLALVALVVAAVVLIVRLLRARSSGPAAGTPSADGALALLRMRYAKGELGRDEFLRMSADLGESPAPGAWAPASALAPPGPPPASGELPGNPADDAPTPAG